MARPLKFVGATGRNPHMPIHEVKGTKGARPFIREDANLKLKLVAKLYSCFRIVVVWRVKGEWRERRVGAASKAPYAAL
jgi:hypothetical protein